MLLDFKTTPLCSICKTRPATKQCDFPTRKTYYIGHPPRYLMLQAQSFNTAFQKIEMATTHTCDKLLCDECAITMGNGIDFCPTHRQEMQIKKPMHQTLKE